MIHGTGCTIPNCPYGCEPLAQKANDPATAPTVPGHGSNIPEQETKMNSTINTTGADPNPPADFGVPPSYYEAWAKCRELGKQLSAALAETGDQDFAFIKPAGMSFPMLFGQIGRDMQSPVEAPVETLDRLAARMAIALDDWADQTNWRAAAHIYPASSGRGYHFPKLAINKVGASDMALDALIERHRAVMKRYDDCSDADWNQQIGELTAELAASAKALLDYRPTTRLGLRSKAEYMLSSKAFTEWDDHERADIIRSLLIEEVLA